MSNSPKKSPTPSPLVVSPENVECLRQILRTESLTCDADLVTLVKEGLANQFRRGFSLGGGQPGKERKPAAGAAVNGRESDSWERFRRLQQRSRLNNIFATVVILLLATGGIATLTMFRPGLSADSPLAGPP